MFEDKSKVIETIEKKLNHHTFDHQDVSFRSDQDTSFEHIVGAVRRATQQRLPDDVLRGMYESMIVDGYESYARKLYMQRDSEHAVAQEISLQEQWSQETKFAAAERNHQPRKQLHSYTTPSSTTALSRNTLSGVAPSQYSGLYVSNGATIGEDGGGIRTASDKRMYEEERKKRRREVQQREMEKREAIEKQIRASQLARFALRKTNRKKKL